MQRTNFPLGINKSVYYYYYKHCTLLQYTIPTGPVKHCSSLPTAQSVFTLRDIIHPFIHGWAGLRCHLSIRSNQQSHAAGTATGAILGLRVFTRTRRRLTGHKHVPPDLFIRFSFSFFKE